jgi:serine/threonine protein kinase
MPLAAGVRIGPYDILALLGAGGMGEVYKARDTRPYRIIALKTLPAEKVADTDRKLRFLSEARAASRLNHPNIVTIYDIAEDNGVCFIAMEYIAGITLEQANAGSGVPLKDALRYAAEIADVLAAAHAAGIIHRDLKPPNIIMTEDGRVKLLDFGVAKLIERAVPSADAETATLQTLPGVIMGTPAYKSPEQAEGRDLDARSDIFSFGLVLYEMLCGQRAFRGESWISTLAAILHTEPQPLREIKAAIPCSVVQHISRCLRKDPAQRFQTMLEVKQALEEASSDVASPFAAPPVVTRQAATSITVLPFVNLTKR